MAAPIAPIPYDEMRVLCGLDPAVRGYCARRDFTKAMNELGTAMSRGMQAIAQAFAGTTKTGRADEYALAADGNA
ncbi:hypothetical protein ABH922_003010 [Rhodococcus sp. 27YEA15]|uniref:hypothetical protein n=1 Tax=Rhodococcus sp. 27YEA15 TaxID=3156259 RepID=UPI003C7E4C66